MSQATGHAHDHATAGVSATDHTQHTAASKTKTETKSDRLAGGKTAIDFQTEPARYRHWKLAVDGEVATLTMDVDEKAGLFEGYDLKLNSYDLGVDIELADAI